MAAILALSLVGCVPAGGTTGSASPTPGASGTPGASSSRPTPSATPTPTPTPDPAATVVVTASGLSVRSAGSVELTAIPFSTPVNDASARLATALGRDPVVSTIAATNCTPETTIRNWDGLNVITPMPYGPDFGAQFLARANGPTAGTLALRSLSDVTVGESLADVQARVPGLIYSELGSGFGSALLDPLPDGNSGLVLTIIDNRVASFVSPVVYLATNDC